MNFIIFDQQVGVAQQQGGNNVIELQACDHGTQSYTFINTSLLQDGHSYVVLLKARILKTTENDFECNL